MSFNIGYATGRVKCSEKQRLNNREILEKGFLFYLHSMLVFY